MTFQDRAESGDSRRQIFRRIAEALDGNGGLESITERRETVADRFLTPVELTSRSAVGLDIPKLDDRFMAAANLAGATVQRAVSIAKVQRSIIEACRKNTESQHGIYAASSGDVRLGPLLRGFPSATTADAIDTSGKTVTLVAPETTDPLTLIAHADLGVAESGAAVFFGTGEVAHRWNALAARLVVLIDIADIVPDYEAVDTKLRRLSSEDVRPWSVSWVAGPSRTADVEQKLIIGAHGPAAVHIVVYSFGKDERSEATRS